MADALSFAEGPFTRIAYVDRIDGQSPIGTNYLDTVIFDDEPDGADLYEAQIEYWHARER